MHNFLFDLTIFLNLAFYRLVGFFDAVDDWFVHQLADFPAVDVSIDLTAPPHGALVIHQQPGQDSVRGYGETDLIIGLRGDDRLEGHMNDDTLLGDEGADFLAGGRGSDLLSGGAGSDVIHGNHHADFLFGGAGADSMSGGRGADLVVGEAGNDSLSGGAGNDTITGGSGRDVLRGNDGHDVLSGEAGNDRVMAGNGDDLLLGGDGADFLHGQSGDDTIAAGRGNDSLIGGAGDDLLVSVTWLTGRSAEDGLPQPERDVLRGGAGADCFEFRWLPDDTNSNHVFSHTQPNTGVVADFDPTRGDHLMLLGQGLGVQRVIHRDLNRDGAIDTALFIGVDNTAGGAGQERIGRVVVLDAELSLTDIEFGDLSGTGIF